MTEPTPPQTPESSPRVGPSGPRATFNQRLGAFLIDSAILLATFVVLFAGSQPVVAQLVALAVNFTYFTCFEGSPSGQTPGKRLLGIRVLDAQGRGPIGYRRGAVRWLGRLVSQLAVLVGYFAMLWDPERQTWHDKMATVVVVPTSAHPVTSWPG